MKRRIEILAFERERIVRRSAPLSGLLLEERFVDHSRSRSAVPSGSAEHLSLARTGQGTRSEDLRRPAPHLPELTFSCVRTTARVEGMDRMLHALKRIESNSWTL